MRIIFCRKALAVALTLTSGVLLVAEQGPPPRVIHADPPGYVRLNQAVAARISPGKAGETGQTGYLGAAVAANDKGLPVVEEVQPDSPAARAGLQKGDIVTHVGGQAVKTPYAFREWLQAHSPSETVKLGLLRDSKPLELAATLAATSRPMKASAARPRLVVGVALAEPKEGAGAEVDQVEPGSPAATAGLKVGDRIIKIDGRELARDARLPEALGEKRPGDTVTFTVRRDDKDLDLKVTLTTDRPGGGRGPRGGGFGGGGGFGAIPLFKKEAIRLAVIGIEFADTKHNEKFTPRELEKACFSKGAYTDKDVTGQKVHGSLNDYFVEQSGGAFRVEGRAFDWVEVAKKRGDYIQGSGTSNRTAVLSDALDKLAARDGKTALDGFDGLLFVYAGERYRTNAGAVYYPHAGMVAFQQKRFLYVIGPEGGSQLTPIGGLVKELAQALGLPDLAARTENRGSEGLGRWCALSDPFITARPQHLSAWAKEKLGWLKPTVVDPTVKQKLILAPIEESMECVKVLVRPDGSEYLLLENRRKLGFDADLSGEGLLIWRVVNDRPILEESHGIEGPVGPTVQLFAVPYPSPANNAFTPDTVPSSRSPLGGGLPVHITEIRKLSDGRITFQVGYEYR